MQQISLALPRADIEFGQTTKHNIAPVPGSPQVCKQTKTTNPDIQEQMDMPKNNHQWSVCSYNRRLTNLLDMMK
jgi:hypothetical protein